VMIRLGRVYRGLMVEMQAVNAKLARRGEDILMRLAEASREAARSALARAGGDLKTAILLLEGCGPEEAAVGLARAGGRLDAAKEIRRSRRPQKERA